MFRRDLDQAPTGRILMLELPDGSQAIGNRTIFHKLAIQEKEPAEDFFAIKLMDGVGTAVQPTGWRPATPQEKRG